MSQLFVKICGMTRPQDAELAASLGASALGFIFWPGSPRSVTAAAAKAITASVPSNVLKVGVFVDQAAGDVARIMDEAGLDVAQLHGHENAEYCRHLMASLNRAAANGGALPASASRRSIFKAVAPENGSVNIDDVDSEIILLIDAHDPQRHGGTGKTVNWDSARQIAATRKTILAGGLTAANIKLAVRTVRPYGVDVSSGVESAPGIKDPGRLRSFFEALHD